MKKPLKIGLFKKNVRALNLKTTAEKNYNRCSILPFKTISIFFAPFGAVFGNDQVVRPVDKYIYEIALIMRRGCQKNYCDLKYIAGSIPAETVELSAVFGAVTPPVPAV